MNDRFDIFRKTGPAVTATGVDEGVADTRVGAYAETDVFHIDIQHIAQSGNFIDKRNFGCQHGVGGILGHLGIAHAHVDGPVPIHVEGSIELPHDVASAVAFGTDNDPVRAHEVFDGCAFLEKFRIAYHVKNGVFAAFLQFTLYHCTHFLGGPHRNGRFIDHHAVVAQILTDFRRDSQYLTQIGATVTVGRGPNGNEVYLGINHGLGKGSCKPQAPFPHIVFNQNIQTRFKNRNLPLLEPGNLGRVGIDTGNSIPHFSKTGSGDKSDITGSDNSQVHSSLPFFETVISY